MAAVGDGYFISESNSDDGTTTIQPASGHEIKLQYVLHVGSGRLDIYDGTNTIVAASNTVGNCWFGQSIILSNTTYAIYTNLSGGTQTVSCHGVYTKVTA